MADSLEWKWKMIIEKISWNDLPIYIKILKNSRSQKAK